MKIQTLNKTQQKRLLSLCKEFFPDYGEPQILNYPCNFDKKDINSAQQIRFYNKTQLIHIHWYQLCLTELPKRIWEKLWTKEQFNEGVPTAIIFDTVFEGNNPLPQQVIISKHPVDFLWEFVKECKKNKYFK